MAITYSAGAGTQITSYAMNETLGSQTQQTNNNTVVASDDVVTAGNGQIGTNTTYVGRLVIINLGTASEQTRFCSSEAAGTGTTVILTVDEDWDTNPAQNDTIHVFYQLDDIENGGAGGGVALNSKTGSYEFSNELFIGNATDPAGLQILGELMEVEDSKSTTVYGVTIRNNGRFQSGYKRDGKPIRGGYVTGINNTDGEAWWEILSGGQGRLYDVRWISALNALDFDVNASSSTSFQVEGFSLFQGTQELKAFDSEWRDGSITGSGGTGEFVRWNAGSLMDNVVLINTAGLHTTDADTSAETVSGLNMTFVGNLTNVTVNSNKTWNLINPIWSIDTSSQDDISFLTGTSNQVNEQYSLDLIVQEPDGTRIANPRVFLYEGTQNDDLIIDLIGNAIGEVADVWTYIEYTDNASTSLNTTTYGSHAVRIFKYGKNPFVAAQTSNAKLDSTITLTTDGNITEADQATAITSGAGILPVFHRTGESDPRPLKVMHFNNGSGTAPTAGQTIAGVGGGSGTLVELLGDNTEGTVVIELWNGTEYINDEVIDNSGSGGSWTATADITGEGSSFYKEYTLELDCSNENLSVTYDYSYAKLAEATLDAIWEQVHEWGNRNEASPIYQGGSGYFTNRSGTEGVWLSNRATGTVAFMTSDDGSTFTPPSSVTFGLTGLQSGSEVRLYDTTTGLEVAGEESTSTTFNYTYTYGGSDVTVNVIIAHLSYKWLKLSNIVLSSSNQSIPIQQIFDRDYDNP